jgi:hypothetical protein
MWVTSVSFNGAVNCHGYSSLVAAEGKMSVLLWWNGSVGGKRKYFQKSLFQCRLFTNSAPRKKYRNVLDHQITRLFLYYTKQLDKEQ